MVEGKYMDRAIGIITFHNTNNFGSWLQTYALYKKLRDIGVKAEVIDYWCDETIKSQRITVHKCVELLRKKSWGINQILYKLLIKQSWLDIYTHRYMKISRQKYDKNNIQRANDYYDTLMVGSDLVWDTRLTKEDYRYMLDFAEDTKKKVAYAASLGYEEIPQDQIKIFKHWLSRFQFITVREDKAQQLLREIIQVPIEVVSDPTMLLTKKEWLSFVKKTNKFGNYVLVYFLDDQQQILKLAKRYAHKHKCKVLFISHEHGATEQHVSPANVSEFLTLIYHAQKIFTASYHGILFSVYFEKQLAYSDRKPENRMRSVARRLGIENLEIHGDEFNLEQRADYRTITPRVKEFREQSLRLLKEMVKERNG